MTLQEVWERGRDHLEKKGVPEPDLDAWYLLEEVWRVERSYYYAHRDEPIDRIETSEGEDLLGRYRDLLLRRGRREPLQHILGYAWFMGLRFVVDASVLIPRQDTEVLVEEARKRLKGGDRVLDMCTGSGCIVLSLLDRCSKAEGVGVDISKEALQVARENSRRLKISAGFIQSDLFAAVEGRFAMIVSNPPYIPTGEIQALMEEVRDHDPHLALDGGADGLDLYRRLIRESLGYLLPGGVLLMEIGADQGGWIRTHMQEQGYRDVQVVKDLAGLDRVVLGYSPCEGGKHV
ncbi:MAG: peptide chain release factor N(5)-glutamine methyltransferase [Lachnospiraceae bacterium]|nr:peptide chain release factor N(5)-glutamine methyltransferase [Lachnospiraceae bacterium]